MNKYILRQDTQLQCISLLFFLQLTAAFLFAIRRHTSFGLKKGARPSLTVSTLTQYRLPRTRNKCSLQETKVVPVHAMNVRRKRKKPQHIFKLGTGFTLRPLYYGRRSPPTLSPVIKADWVPGPVRAHWRREKSLFLVGDQTAIFDCPVHSLVKTPTTVCWLRLSLCHNKC